MITKQRSGLSILGAVIGGLVVAALLAVTTSGPAVLRAEDGRVDVVPPFSRYWFVGIRAGDDLIVDPTSGTGVVVGADRRSVVIDEMRVPSRPIWFWVGLTGAAIASPVSLMAPSIGAVLGVFGFIVATSASWPIHLETPLALIVWLAPLIVASIWAPRRWLKVAGAAIAAGLAAAALDGLALQVRHGPSVASVVLVGATSWPSLRAAIVEFRAADLPSLRLRLLALVDRLVPGRLLSEYVGAEAERQRIAADIHAEVLPHLNAIMAAGPVDAAVETKLRVVSEELRTIVATNYPVVLEAAGLVVALVDLAESVEGAHQIGVELEIVESTGRPPRLIERAAYRIAQLAVDNAVRHGHPTTINVDVGVSESAVLLRVADDGIGFDPEAAATAAIRGHHGLIDMRRTADAVGATLDIKRRSPTGTEVLFEWHA
jgi:signal transduction histidine kinase